MSSRTRGTAALLIALGASSLGAQAPKAAPDTVDVTPGSRVVDFSRHTPSTSRTAQFREVNGQTTPMPVVLWKFAFSDTGGRPLLHVRSELEQPPAGPPGPPSVYVILDRKTLALHS